MGNLWNFTDNGVTKASLGIAAGVIGYLADCMNELLIVLITLIIVDYIVGMIAAAKHGGFKWSVAAWGTVKKLMYGALILLGFLLDYVLMFVTEKIGLDLPVSGMFGFALIIYLIGTEGFSSIQNLILIGLDVPDFIAKAFGLIRDASGSLVKVEKAKKAEVDKPEDPVL